MTQDGETLDKIEELLRVNCPPPEAHLVKIGKIMAALPDGERSARLRRLVLDVDDLIGQIRWHLGQALLLMQTQTDIIKAGENDDELVKGLGMATAAQLLLRKYIIDADRVLYNDLSTPRRGGTVGGWIFHMMIDGAVYRVICALDRLATILWHVAELPMERIYFRSRKIKKVHNVISSKETGKLLKISEGKLLNFILDYRDGLTHSAKAYSRLAGFPPTDHWTTEDGRSVFWEPDKWDADLLFALGRGSYFQVTEALEHTTTICEKKWPIPSHLAD